jgi:hypothetical protein
MLLTTCEMTTLRWSAQLAVLLAASCGRGAPLGARLGGGTGDASADAVASGHAGTTGGGAAGISSGFAGASGGAGETTSGAGGAAGVVGVGGGGSGQGPAPISGEAGGTFGASCSWSNPACGDALCGNGKRDTCISGSCRITEVCDGTDLGGQTCTSRGFGSGTQRCSATCSWSEDCRDCMPPSGGFVGCVDAPSVDTSNSVPGIGATETAVGLAWNGGSSTDEFRNLRFAILSPSLEAQTGVVTLEPATPGAPLPLRAVMGTAVAPLGTGWLVAAAGEPTVFVHAVDANGQDLGRTNIAEVAPDTFQWPGAITLAPRADGGPLVVWASPKFVRAAVIAADGRSASAPIELPLDTTNPTRSVSAAFVAGAFYVIYPQASSLRLVRVDVDGTVTKVADLIDQLAAAPFLAAGVNELRLSYLGTPPGAKPVGDQSAPDPTVMTATDPRARFWAVLWRRLSLAGATLAGPVVVGSGPDWVGPSPIGAAGDDSVIMVGGTDELQLGVARVSPAGVVTGPIPFAKDPYRVRFSRMARRGPDLIATWLSPQGSRPDIELARFTY